MAQVARATEKDCRELAPGNPSNSSVRVTGADRITLAQLDGAHITCTAQPAVASAVPQETFIAIGYDAQGEIESVSRPFRAPAEVVLARPQVGSDVLAILSGDGKDAIALLQERKPDVRIEREGTLTAIWYGIEDRLATLTMQSRRAFLEPVEIRPRNRAVTSVREELRPLPSLRVSIEAPADAFTDARIRLKREGQSSPVEARELHGVREVRFELLERAAYTVELVLPEWTATKRVDLTSGTDLDTTIELSPIAITGRITRDGKPARAQVSMRYGANLPRTTTDGSGQYELRVWMAGRYQIEITPSEPAGSTPYVDMLLVTADEMYDLDLPDNRVSLLVLDGTTQKPIANARVNVQSAWQDPKQGRRSVMRDVKTGADGIAILPPVQPGQLTLRAWAEGYLDGEPLSVVIPAGEHERKISLRLTNESETSSLTIVLPNGARAVEAEVIVLRDLIGDGVVQWRGRSDEQGLVRIPRSLGGAYVLVRHEAAASAIRRWQPQSSDAWPLRPAAGPLIVHARDHEKNAVGGARVTAWLDGTRVNGDALAFLTWSYGVTEGNGVWIAKNLATMPVRVLIGPTNNAFDALATHIKYPWPSPLAVERAD